MDNAEKETGGSGFCSRITLSGGPDKGRTEQQDIMRGMMTQK